MKFIRESLRVDFFLYLLAGFEPGAYLNSGSADKSKTEPLRRSPYT